MAIVFLLEVLAFLVKWCLLEVGEVGRCVVGVAVFVGHLWTRVDVEVVRFRLTHLSSMLQPVRRLLLNRVLELFNVYIGAQKTHCDLARRAKSTFFLLLFCEHFPLLSALLLLS